MSRKSPPKEVYDGFKEWVKKEHPKEILPFGMEKNAFDVWEAACLFMQHLMENKFIDTQKELVNVDNIIPLVVMAFIAGFLSGFFMGVWI